MLIDLHAHSAGISTCCKADGAAILAAARSVGIDGLCLCNHYYTGYMKDRGETPAEFAKSFLTEYEQVKALADGTDLRLYFGIEVSPELYHRVHLLVYGVETDFVLRHPEMYDYTQEQLYTTVHENGGYLVQAHPLRRGRNVLLDPRFLDGVEISSHLLYDGTHYDELAAFAKENGLFLTSGGDYHADTPRAKCGVYLPDELTDIRSVMEHIRTSDGIRILYQESTEAAPEIKIFKKN